VCGEGCGDDLTFWNNFDSNKNKTAMNAQSEIYDMGRDTTVVSPHGCCKPQMSYANVNSSRQKFPETALWNGRPSNSAYGWTAKRLYDVCFSFYGLVLLAPLFLLIAALVKMADGGDVFYRQARVGRGGRQFLIYKFRTMVSAAEKSGPSVTKNGDVRITWIGRILRKTKLDELPQLWNVLKGDMSLVGPRPEVPRYVRYYTPEQRVILWIKPGITDLASLCFRDEEALLANADNVEEFYIRYCIPRKIQLNLEYAGRANLFSDTWIILQTVCPYWVGVLACYGMILAASFWLSCELIYNFAPPALVAPRIGRELFVTLGLQLACLMWHRQCRGLLSYFSFPEVRKFGVALGLAALGLLAWSVASNDEPSLNVILVNALLSFCLLGGFRILLRRWRERSAREQEAVTDLPARVGIIGAGSTGAQLALELGDNRKSGRRVVAFFDDDFHKWQKSIHDVPVAGMPECLLDGWAEKLDEVVIAVPDARAERIGEIEQLLRKTSLKFYTVASPSRFWERRQTA
jgi:lipopolysaccharide/colanic/teichoic acid biosynthesis glycosyltransferase